MSEELERSLASHRVIISEIIDKIEGPGRSRKKNVRNDSPNATILGVAGPALKPVGIGADRIDLHGDALRISLQPQLALQVPKQEKTRRDEKRVGQPGWNQQEQVVQTQGDLRQEKHENWRRFQSGTGRHRNHGAIQIDGASAPSKTLAPVTAGAPQQLGPWQKIDQWYGRAARFEEASRSSVGKLGNEPNVEVDPTSPAPRTSGGSSKKRRRFTVA